LKLIDREVPKGQHIVLDNYATHKHENVRTWLEEHKRFHLHFTPTSSSWLNLVERWFRDITTKRIRRGRFGNVGELVTTIEDYIAHNNEYPRPFTWTKTAKQIITKVRCGRVALTGTPTARYLNVTALASGCERASEPPFVAPTRRPGGSGDRRHRHLVQSDGWGARRGRRPHSDHRARSGEGRSRP
jgi:transposase